MLGISAERYILICHAARAKQFLSVRNRLVFCSLVTIVYAILSLVPFYAFYLTAKGYMDRGSVSPKASKNLAIYTFFAFFYFWMTFATFQCECGYFQKSLSLCDWCVSRKYAKHVLVLKYAVLQVPCVIISGLLYAFVIARLRQGNKKNNRKSVLTKTFFALWFCWVICSTPYSAYEAYESFFWNFDDIFDTAGGIGLALDFHQRHCLSHKLP